MQGYVSASLEGLDFKAKYLLTDYIDREKPLVMFGMYRESDIDTLQLHRSNVILVWQGMDAKSIDPNWLYKIRNKPDVKHYSISHWIKHSLDSYNLKSIYKPISATVPNINCEPRGSSIYFYSSDASLESANYHGEYMIEEIKRRTGLNVIRTTHGLYTREQVLSLYKECFINLRLTKYDGCPNTNLEMGLMGRRSIFNGYLPGSIPWKCIDDVCDSIWTEFINRDSDNKKISEDINKFLNIKFP